jgi:hypothetical protein
LLYIGSFVRLFDGFDLIGDYLLLSGLIGKCVALFEVLHDMLHLIVVCSIQEIGFGNG